ncbi:MAG TPA: hypothetical protein VEA81_00225 [Burkholderiaceae bacterium]|nr:hypothetical protein [Burkholderiaceae bacterium]
MSSSDFTPVPLCKTCKYAVLERVPGADHLLCRHAEVVATFANRARVAASVVREQMCQGRRWKPREDAR